ncbi:phage integrase family protein [Vibrio sp. MEBiC08052]|nr:phage integrase family protein [Vibrio sp. MEBiC08052]
MASFSIKKRKLKSGEVRFTADIIVKKNSAIIHRESKTFRKRELARTYGRKRVDELEDPTPQIQKSVPLSVLIDMYMNDRDLWDKTGRTKQYVIRMLRDCDIARLESNQLKTSDLIDHCRNRKAAGAKPATIYHDIAYLRSVMKKAK